MSKIVKRGDGCWNWEGSKNKKGYGSVNLRRIGKIWSVSSCFRAHRVAKSHFSGVNLLDTRYACHKCDNPSCVNPDHIFMGTASDNMLDMASKGRCSKRNQKGSSNGNSKLKENDILEIKDKLSSMTNIDIAKEYGVHHATISLIRRNKTWK